MAMNPLLGFLKFLADKIRKADFWIKYSAAVAMTEGSRDIAREFLEDAEGIEDQYAALRLEFKTRYHNFKLLLQANNAALENMGGIERALLISKPFSMSFVREKVTAVSINVFRMMRNLEEIAPGKYSRLEKTYATIQDAIIQILEPKRDTADARMIIPLSDIDASSSHLVGNKMGKIGEIKNQIGLEVPDGFVITSAASRRIIETNKLQEKIDKHFQTLDFEDMKSIRSASLKIQQLIVDAVVPEDLKNEIVTAYSKLNIGDTAPMVALRSSALGEDLAKTSFAGQYHSELNISEQNLINAYKRVLASKYGLQAITYRFNRGLKDEDIIMSVGCMMMLDSVSGGVIYSRNPIHADDLSVYIDSCWGLPKTVVEGNAACDEFVVSRNTPHKILVQTIRCKKTKYVCSAHEGIIESDVAAEAQNSPSLNAYQVSALTEIALKLEDYYREPQDIEWAITGNQTIHILQCRPLVQAKKESTHQEAQEPVYDRTNLLAEGGTTVCSGAVYGPVHWIETGADVPDFPEGAILATSQSLPRWAPLLSKAKGIVTEEGSFAGHLANVAREFNIPALFGLPGIKGILENGRMITLDSSRREIHKGRVDSLLADSIERKNLMVGSPVYQTLLSASRYIVPLNLLEPDAADFRPSNCKTLHDITRFIHEKSVTEMFNFGKTHHFSERSAKQLFYKVPMKWWILNLDDGFIKETGEKYVTLDNIASIPMLALWEGIVAIPWEGPPPLDGRGLMSVMFQARTNVALTVGNTSHFADKNYFMISRNFCSLSSRLGFHFSTVESMVSDKREENYISFQYKGGAADYQRRLNRVLFLGELLEEYGFKSSIRSDNLIARLENRNAEFIKERLRILGYLIIHTRQIDMIMLNNSSINYYQKKFNKDIATLLSGGSSSD